MNRNGPDTHMHMSNSSETTTGAGARIDFQQTFYDQVLPILNENPELENLLTLIGIGLIVVQMFVLFKLITDKGFKAVFLPLIGLLAITTALVFPSVMMPLWLGLIDTLVNIVLSIFT